jgi:hypothetical protein
MVYEEYEAKVGRREGGLRDKVSLSKSRKLFVINVIFLDYFSGCERSVPNGGNDFGKLLKQLMWLDEAWHPAEAGC